MPLQWSCILQFIMLVTSTFYHHWLIIVGTCVLFQIVSVYYYVCVAALQFVAPLILSLYLALMYKSLGKLP